MVKTKLAKNTLYQYRGGGYEGCVWEWNFCYLDKKGKFHDIHSSGYAAITYKEQLQALIDTAETSFHTKKPFTYDLANADDRLEFVRECNPGHVIGVAKWLSENADIELDLECKECGHSHHVEDMIPEGVESAGGLAFQYSSMICADCESNYTCCNCGEYMGSDENNWIEAPNVDLPPVKEGYCTYCNEEEQERLKKLDSK